MTPSFDLEDPIHVASAWSAIIEPGDPAAGILRDLLGEVPALQWIMAPTAAALPSTGERTIPWEKCHARWHPRALLANVTEDLRRARLLGARLLPRGAPEWPQALADLEEREPFGLWLLGEGAEQWAELPAVAVVGSRASTNYGSRVASGLSSDLASQGIVVVSGGAYGIDAAAHRGALAAAEGAPTVAVLCGGLGNLYPVGNLDLFHQIQKNGLLISEVPPHWRPARWRFLERNRLIAALGAATVVVEAGQRSGAIATANRALDLGRTVAAVPGAVTSAASRGCHRLIQEGATLVTSATEVAELMGVQALATPGDNGPAGLRQVEKLVLDAFPRNHQATVQELALSVGLAAEEVGIALLGLKILGLVSSENGQWSLKAA